MILSDFVFAFFDQQIWINVIKLKALFWNLQYTSTWLYCVQCTLFSYTRFYSHVFLFKRVFSRVFLFTRVFYRLSAGYGNAARFDNYHFHIYLAVGFTAVVLFGFKNFFFILMCSRSLFLVIHCFIYFIF